MLVNRCIWLCKLSSIYLRDEKFKLLPACVASKQHSNFNINFHTSFVVICYLLSNNDMLVFGLYMQYFYSVSKLPKLNINFFRKKTFFSQVIYNVISVYCIQIIFFLISIFIIFDVYRLLLESTLGKSVTLYLKLLV